MSIRNILIRLVATIIYQLRKKTLRNSKARFLVFTGTSGKTLARSATAYALRKKGYTVISPPYGYTNELGIVLAALGIESTKLFSVVGLRRVFFETAQSEAYICIELGADWYPDTRWFLKHFEPFGVCLTNSTRDEWVRKLSTIWEERRLLVANISSSGFVCYSSQNESIEEIKKACSVSSVTSYEFTSTYKDKNLFECLIGASALGVYSPYANLVPYREAFGAAITCLYALGVSVSHEDFFSEYKSVAHRLDVTQLTSGATLVADTYKAIPQCTEYVLRLAESIPKEKKIVVLSEMRPIWKNKKEHYNKLLPFLKGFNEVYFIGPPDIMELLSGQLSNVHSITSEQEYEALAKKITASANKETLYVVKGSGYYHLSRLVTLLR